MEYAFIALVSLSFGFIICNVINHKKMDIISAILFVILACLACIMVLDVDYYNDKFGEINNFMLYSVIAGALLLLSSLSGYFLGYKKHNKNSKKEDVDIDAEISIKEPLTNININQEEYIQAYMEMFNEPIAFYINDNYLLNSAMKKVLKLDVQRISKDQLLGYKNYEDRKRNTVNSDNTQCFRFKTQENNIWFEEAKATINKHEYYIIRMARIVQNEKIKVYNFKDLAIEIDGLISQNSNFTVVMINIRNYNDIQSFYGKDFADLAISKYLSNLHNISYISEMKMYYIGATEYALLLKNNQEYDILLRELERDNSTFLSTDLYIGQTQVNVNSRMAIINVKELTERNSKSIIAVAFEASQMVSSKDYPGEYIIYKQVNSEKEYGLEDLNINLDLDLKKYQDRLK